METGKEIIKRTVRTIPNKPGVYRMLDKNKDIIYVGKAKNLSKRVKSYASKNIENKRIEKMVNLIHEVEFTTTDSEENALLLEVNLIKQHKPKYNILMRDDKSFPYIFISTDHDFPRLEKHRGARKRPGHYYGPFPNAGAINRTIKTIQKAFLLRTCSDKEVESGNKPCFNYHLKRCSGPCGGKISKEEYSKLVNDVKKIFRGDAKQIKSQFAKKMEAASKNQKYEEAAYYRDRIKSLSNLTNSFSINPKNLIDADVFSISKNEKYACIQVFFFRSRKNLGNKPFFINNIKGLNELEILESFIPQFYSNRPSPKLILTSTRINEKEIIQNLLASQNKIKVKIQTPLRGEKKEIIEHAIENSKDALRKYTRDMLSKKINLKNLQKTLQLNQIPQRIEVFDNSHIQGAFSTGAMIVSGVEGFIKNQYRKFNIKEAKTNDDFGMMYEVLHRRFVRLKNKSKNDEDFPDLIVIDGGKGQLSMAEKAMIKTNINNIEIISISKGENRNDGNEIIHTLSKDSIVLRKSDPSLFYLQRLRDEAHRFAIGSHRQKRDKNIHFNPLDEIPGIGSKRKKDLLNAFGSAKGVSKAKIRELSEVDGISKNLAQNIYNWFNELN
ncbi:MAG: excinuclease ABC subunit UvrC [Alphaproteobacteria bacterium]